MKKNLILLIMVFACSACGLESQFGSKSGLHEGQVDVPDQNVDDSEGPEGPNGCFDDEVCEPEPGCEQGCEGEGEEHPCDAILWEVGECDSPEEMDAVFEEYEACLGEDFEDECAPILDDVDENAPPEEIDGAFEEYDECLGDWEVNECDAILEGLEHVVDPEELDLVLMAYDACIADEITDDLFVCDAILEDLDQLPPEEHEIVFEMYDDCLNQLGEAHTECDEIFAYAGPNEDPGVLDEMYLECIGDDDFDRCDDILVGLDYVSTPEEEEAILAVHQTCVDQNFEEPVEPNEPNEEEPNEPQPGM